MGIGLSSIGVTHNEAPLYRLDLEESEADGKDEIENCMEGAQKVWRNMRVKT